MKRAPRRLTLLAASLLVSGLTFVAATPVAAYGTCPSGWSQVTATQVAHLTMFCHQGAGLGHQDRYFLIAPKESVGQALTLPGGNPNNPYGNAGNPNPAYVKRSVSAWMPYLRGFWGSTVQVVINGDFFEPGDPNATISYPIFQTAQLVTAARLPNAQDSAHRKCIAWGSTVNPATYTWSYANNDWAGTQSYGFNNCNTSSPYHRIVGLEPTWFPGGDSANALTMMGSNGSSLCFLVGGWQTRATASTYMSTFGCTARVQLDGGHSSQMSYWSGSQVDAVTGYIPEWNRPVPHVIVFF